MAQAGVPLRIVPHVTYDSRDVVAGRGASTSLGGWEVTTGFDPIRCEVYCLYRQKPDASGRTPLIGLLAPPITIVEVYTGPASKPVIVTFDPAGLGSPAATARFVAKRDGLALPGRKVAFAVPHAPSASERPSASGTSFRSPVSDSEPALHSALPLRI